LCQKRTSARYSIISSARPIFQIDRQLVFSRRLYRQVGWLLALEDAINGAGRPAILVDKVGVHTRSGRLQPRSSHPDRSTAIGGELQMMIRPRCTNANGLPVTISPPLELLANAMIARSISLVSRILIALASIPNDDAAA